MKISFKKAKQGKPTKSRARSNANLRPELGTLAPRTDHRPQPTVPGLADLFVKLLMAGFPGPDALRRTCPEWCSGRSPKEITLLATHWLNSSAVVAAVDAYNGGIWHELPLSTRVEKARDHHVSQSATLLFTSDIFDENADLGLIRDARGVVNDFLKETKGSGENAYTKALRDIIDGTAKASGPPQLVVKVTEKPADVAMQHDVVPRAESKKQKIEKNVH